MNQTRTAAILLIDRPLEKRWEFKNHVVKTIGRQQGAALRNVMSVPLKNAAQAAHVSLYGKAANSKVQSEYLKQFQSWGLKKNGKNGVIWP
ncbi:hypothetical protein [Lacisediminihabitans changchengi]|uniref:Uncharacterized protein n=1 Tax=Lacisediminihabitans changchengi TaxID=2787634 RepID=A0A934W2C7_9MICO|nr:hypothetical protein [Lacisediminihabitans changchengi]MBK4347099.1 hypothetical protein [Lacisediminihabitans changchengi]MBK4347778.1 hypothetical protein [Lacisediminihabitans changchengi]